MNSKDQLIQVDLDLPRLEAIVMVEGAA